MLASRGSGFRGNHLGNPGYVNALSLDQLLAYGLAKSKN